MAKCPVCEMEASYTGLDLGGFEIHRCRICGLRFAPEAFRLNVDYTLIYDTPEYEDAQLKDIVTNRDPIRFSKIITYRPFFHHVQNKNGARLLDVGCGVGRFCHAAAHKGWDVTGIDISSKAVAIGKQFAKFPIHNCSIDDMIRQGEQFEIITFFELLEHLSDPKGFLLGCKQLLNTNGQIFCTVPNWDCDGVKNATRADCIPPVHLTFYTKDALVQLFRISGYRVLVDGKIRIDPFPSEVVQAIKWLARRVLGRHRSPLGLWLHCRLD